MFIRYKQTEEQIDKELELLHTQHKYAVELLNDVAKIVLDIESRIVSEMIKRN